MFRPLFPRGVKQTRGWRMSSHLKLQIIINVLFADKDGKRRHFKKTERDILPPRITAFDIESIDILADSGEKKEDGETEIPDAGGNGDDILGTKSLSYDPAWEDDEE